MILDKKFVLSVGELKMIDDEITILKNQIEASESNSSKLDGLLYRVTYLGQVVETSLYWARRKKLTLIKTNAKEELGLETVQSNRRAA